MTNIRRNILTRTLERVAFGLALLDVVLYFAVVRPLVNLAQEKFEQSEEVRLHIQNEKARVTRLEWYKSALPQTEKDINNFLRNEVKSRRNSYSRSTRLVQGLAEHSGINLTGISYRMESLRDQPLDLMSIGMTVEGPLPSLLNFAHGLETTTGDFIVIREFAFESGEGKDLSLRLAAQLYLTP